MKERFIPYLLVLTFLVCTQQATRGQTYFQKVYLNSPYDQEGQDVYQMADGGYLIAGYTTNITLNDMDVEVIKTDPLGDKVWSKTYGGGKPDYIHRMLPCSDGNYFLIGSSQSYGGGDWDVLLLKIDPVGNLLWLKTYGGWGNDQGMEIVLTDDGNYMIVGNSGSGGAGGQDVYMIKIDAGGVILWDKYLGGSANDFGSSIKQTADGGYIIAGITFSSGTDGDAYLVKTDAAGNMAWSQTFGDALYDEAVYVTAKSDGSIVFAVRDSTSGKDIETRVIKEDAAGNVVWDKSYGGTRKDTPKMVQPTSDGGYVVAAISRSFGLPTPDMWIVKLDANGDSTWTRRYGGSQNEHCYTVRELSDGSYIACGKTTSYSPNFETILVKTNPMGTLTTGADQSEMLTAGFTVFPNPSDGKVSIDLRGIPARRIIVTDVCGREVYADENMNNLTDITLQGCGSGLYFVSVRSGHETYTRKLLLK